ncbi:MAG: ATP-binding protein [Desulfuromonadales bacterium]
MLQLHPPPNPLPSRAYTSDELLNLYVHDVVLPDDHGILAEHLAAIYSGRPALSEWRLMRKDGTSFHVEVRASVLDDGQRLAIVRDITERRRAEEERVALESQFQQTQKLESLGVLAGGIAHDFNNILTIILGHCYIVGADIDSGISHKSHVKEIEKASARAVDLCRQMLSYAGKSVMVQTEMNLRLLVEENIKMLQSAIKKNVSIQLHHVDDLPSITGDSAQIQQVVMNLIINAAEAIGDSNGAVRITLSRLEIRSTSPEVDVHGAVIPPGSYACFSVADNGCGMDTETQKRIFEPFFTTKFAGRGLGMSAVLGIISSHRGALKLVSAPGSGTVFRVYFPLSAVLAGMPAVPVHHAIPAAQGNGTILLVEDETTLRLLGEILLKAIGFTVLTAADGRKALDIYRDRRDEIDLVLTDMLMPEMNGIDTYRHLRAMSPVTPVVICSGCDASEIEDIVGNDPFAAVVQKPYRPLELQNTLIRLIATSGVVHTPSAAVFSHTVC